MLSAWVKLKDFWCRQPFARMLSVELAGEGSCRRRVVSLPLQHPWNEWRIVLELLSHSLVSIFTLSQTPTSPPCAPHQKQRDDGKFVCKIFTLSGRRAAPIWYPSPGRRQIFSPFDASSLRCCWRNCKMDQFWDIFLLVRKEREFFPALHAPHFFLLPSICKRWRKMKDSLFCVFSWDGGREHTLVEVESNETRSWMRVVVFWVPKKPKRFREWENWDIVYTTHRSTVEVVCISGACTMKRKCTHESENDESAIRQRGGWRTKFRIFNRLSPVFVGGWKSAVFVVFSSVDRKSNIHTFLDF